MKIKDILGNTRGATAIEYSLIVALIALAIIGAVQALGGGTGGLWTIISERFTTAVAPHVG